MKLKRIQKPRGHKEERASFPDQFHTRVSKIHNPKILILEKREGTGRRRRRRRLAEGVAPRLGAWQGARKREWVSRYLYPLIPELKD